MSTSIEVTEWTPPDALSGYAKDPNYAYRFASKDRKDKGVKYWQQQGYFIVNDAGATERKDGGSSMDGATHWRGLVLMACRKEVAEQRRAHYQKKSQDMMGAARAFSRLQAESDRVNQNQGGIPLTSAFMEATATKGRTLLNREQFDSYKKVLQNIDPAQLQELIEMNRLQMEENQRLRAQVQGRPAPAQ